MWSDNQRECVQSIVNGIQHCSWLNYFCLIIWVLWYTVSVCTIDTDICIYVYVCRLVIRLCLCIWRVCVNSIIIGNTTNICMLTMMLKCIHKKNWYKFVFVVTFSCCQSWSSSYRHTHRYKCLSCCGFIQTYT